jgi:hypothetical protein
MPQQDKNLILIKRSEISGVKPPLSSLDLGELGVNTADGKLFLKTEVNSVTSIKTFLNNDDQYFTFDKTLSSVNTQYGNNTVTEIFGSVLGGYNNNISGGASTVVNGEDNDISGNFSLIGTGLNNKINIDGDYSFIAAGSENLINHSNVFVLGSGLSSHASNFTYVNNLSATGRIYANGIEITGDGVGSGSDTEVRSLTSNWESTYTSVKTNCANWDAAYEISTAYQAISSTFLTSETDSQQLTFNETTKDLSISNGNTVSLSALSVGTSVFDPEKFVFVGNGITTTYSISGTNNSTNAATIEVFVNNVRQEPEISYTLLSDVVQFTHVPTLSSRIVILNSNFSGTVSNGGSSNIDPSSISNWDSVYTTVQANSASYWDYQGTDIKALTGNFDSTFTTVQTNSASWFNSKTIAFFTALDNEPPATNFATFDTRNSHLVLDFDTVTQEAAIFRGIIPEGINLLSGCSVITQWAATSATTGTIGWDVAFERIASNGINLGTDSFDTPQTITATTVPSTSGITLTTSVTFTQAQLPSSLTNGNMYRLRVRRDVVNDTASGDAELLGLEIRSIA